MRVAKVELVLSLSKEKEQLPPMKNEPNQAQIDAAQAAKLREAAQERRDKDKK